MWEVLHSNLMLYEAHDVHEAMMVHKQKIDISQSVSTTSKAGVICPCMENSDYGNVMSIWKCRCNRLYDAEIQVSLMYYSRYGRNCWQQSMVSMIICMVLQKMLIREGRSFFTYGESCPSLQCQIKGLNGTIEFHGPFCWECKRPLVRKRSHNKDLWRRNTCVQEI